MNSLDQPWSRGKLRIGCLSQKGQAVIQLLAHKGKTTKKEPQWATMENYPIFPLYGDKMGGDHYELRTVCKKSKELSSVTQILTPLTSE